MQGNPVINTTNSNYCTFKQNSKSHSRNPSFANKGATISVSPNSMPCEQILIEQLNEILENG